MKLKPAAFVNELRGRMGGVVCRQLNGQTVMSRRPDHSKRRQKSAAEIATQDNFHFAAKWARHVRPQRIPLYDERAAREGITKFSSRIRDYMTPPVIVAVVHELYTGRAGQRIAVVARDDFEVKDVTITIHTGAGALVEKGEAVRVHGDAFAYTTTRDVPPGTGWKLEVVVRDWPENRAVWNGTNAATPSPA